jgi:anti-sigma-K factor RskA
MTREADLVTRAGSYVLGMMEESDRQRAERDLEIDPAFRDAVLRVAERMHLLDLNPTDATQSDFWKTVSARIGDLPQMPTREQQSVRSKIPASATDPNACMLTALLAAACLAGYVTGLVTAHLW